MYEGKQFKAIYLKNHETNIKGIILKLKRLIEKGL